MAIYHFSAKVFSRSDHVSIIARAAYRSGSRMKDNETGKTYDYRRKKEVVYHAVSLCSNAPKCYGDSQTLWTEVQKAEKTANSQLAREIEVALPVEYNREQQIVVLNTFINQNFTAEGMICDWSIHDKSGNPHAHLLLTIRPIKKDGTWGPKKTSRTKLDADGNRIPVIDPKTGEQKKGARNRLIWEREMIPSTTWNSPESLRNWRTSWAEINNQALSKMHVDPISEKSHAERKLTAEPTIHEGCIARRIEARGGISERCHFNREIRKKNLLLSVIKSNLVSISQMIKSLTLRYMKSLTVQIMNYDEHEYEDITR